MTNTAPRWLFWVSLLFLIWNLFGIAAFISQWNMSATDIAKLPDVQQRMWSGMGSFTWGAYALAVLSGTAGAVSLLMKRKWAVLAFLVSVAALIAQFSNPIGFALGAGEVQLILFPLFIIAMAVLELFLARGWKNRGWLA